MNTPKHLHSLTNLAKTSIVAPTLPRPPIRNSDFDWSILILLLCLAAGLCISNYILLTFHPITRRLLGATLRYRFARGQKRGWTFQIPCTYRIPLNFMLKVGLPAMLYLLESNSGQNRIVTGIVFAVSFFAYNTYLLISNFFLRDRSVFRLKDTLYRISPALYRVRLIFEVARRYLYFIVACTFITYGLHRLVPESYSSTMPQIPLIAQHFKMNLHGIHGSFSERKTGA